MERIKNKIVRAGQFNKCRPLCGRYPPNAMTVHPVSMLVNQPANDGPRCIAPVSPT